MKSKFQRFFGIIIKSFVQSNVFRYQMHFGRMYTSYQTMSLNMALIQNIYAQSII